MKKKPTVAKPSYEELEERCRKQFDIIVRLQKVLKDAEELGNEILVLRRSVSSYKGANTKLKEQVVHFRELCKESDEMNEKNRGTINDMKAALLGKDQLIKERDKTIDGLQSQVMGLNKIIKDKVKEIESLKFDVTVAEENLEYYMGLPWYRKIFKAIQSCHNSL